MTRQEEIIDAILVLGTARKPGLRAVRTQSGLRVTRRELNLAWLKARVAHATPVGRVPSAGLPRRCRGGVCFYSDLEKAERDHHVPMRTHITADKLALIHADPHLMPKD